jgi:hypothetical protein
MIYLWIGVSFIGYVFFVDHPRTHLQIIYPGWSLLVALAATGLLTRLGRGLTFLPRRWLAVGAVAITFLLFALFAIYQYLLFADAGREYVFTYPRHKNSFYWEDPDFPFGSRRLYGVPHRLGWQMVRHLYAQGDLQGAWDSNDEGTNLFWYTLGAQRNPCYPRYYFLTQFQQRQEAGDLASFNQTDYVQIGQIWNRDRLQIEIYEFAPLGRDDAVPTTWAEPARYTSFVVPDDFHSSDEETMPDISNLLPSPPVFRPNPSALTQIADQYGDPRIVNVRDTVTLLGYDLDDTWAEPGGLVVLTLYWQATEVVNLPYKVFTHLVSDEAATGSSQLWAQADDFPACGTRPTYRWPVNETITDRHVLRLPADIPPGEYVLRIGLYEPKTGLRMDLLDELSNPQGISFDLIRVIVHPKDGGI